MSLPVSSFDLSIGYVKNARELQQDRARGKLFEWVNDEVFERPTYKGKYNV